MSGEARSAGPGDVDDLDDLQLVVDLELNEAFAVLSEL